MRDVWRQYDFGVHDSGFTQEVRRHGAVLLRLYPAAEATAAGPPIAPKRR